MIQQNGITVKKILLILTITAVGFSAEVLNPFQEIENDMAKMLGKMQVPGMFFIFF